MAKDKLRTNQQLKKTSRILVINTRRIGDVLLATPLIRSLRLALPDAKIDVLVFETTAGVLAANPDIDQVLVVAERPDWRSHLRLLQQIGRRYDIALSSLPSDRATLYARIAARRSIGLAEQGGKHLWKKLVLSQTVLFDNINTHTVLMNLQLADALGIPRCHQVIAAWNAQHETAVREVLPFDPDAQAFAVLHVYPMYTYKAWRREAWIELADWLNKQGMRIVLTGGAGAEEMAFVQNLLPLLPRDSVNVAGELNLAGVAFMLSKARVYVGPDTVVTHLAAATGTPTVALFGPSNPVKWGPWPKGYAQDRNPYQMLGTQRVNNVVVVQGSGNCVPCMEEGCDRHIASLSDCLQNLPAASAINAVRELLNLPLETNA